jgi:hypothetical protein
MPGDPSDSVTSADNRRKSAKSPCPRILAFFPLDPDKLSTLSMTAIFDNHRNEMQTCVKDRN